MKYVFWSLTFLCIFLFWLTDSLEFFSLIKHYLCTYIQGVMLSAGDVTVNKALSESILKSRYSKGYRGNTEKST
jgi:hypothetical protein